MIPKIPQSRHGKPSSRVAVQEQICTVRTLHSQSTTRCLNIQSEALPERCPAALLPTSAQSEPNVEQEKHETGVAVVVVEVEEENETPITPHPPVRLEPLPPPLQDQAPPTKAELEPSPQPQELPAGLDHSMALQQRFCEKRG